MTRALTTAAAGLLALSLATTSASAQKAEDAVGVWLNPDNGSNIEFYKCGDGVCGKIVKVTDGQKTDDKNPDAAKKNRPIVGLVIMQGAKKTGDNKWEGSLLNTDNGNTYKGYVTLEGSGLNLQGCALGGIVCTGETWQRVK